MITFALKLLLAHLLGDFLLQPASWTAHKEVHKIRSKYLYLHVLVHFVCMVILFIPQWKYMAVILIITASHFIIDLIKVKLTGKFKDSNLFLADQAAHILVILIATEIYFPFVRALFTFYGNQLVLLTVCILFVTTASAIIMRKLISRWDTKEWLQSEEERNVGLIKAGAYIGILERLFVFVFIIIQHWEVVGFLLGAKSIFRFGDLTKAKDRGLTEYILIGTLLSFGLAILAGLFYQMATTVLGFENFGGELVP